MANGMLCKYCGWKEIEHKKHEYVNEKSISRCKPGKKIR
jgi:hypothetical protein